uniref:Uncharacterized protein n=1 Tax=Oryza sativa subsp. japonica TaxID=39947 RepID=Q5Z6K3_ORYSJ|nr:hypothetical protein [Oryza sativa Japonica Group]BAD68422.1 hypothetical protein [Oryza sativa Japonica Group]
MAPSCGTEAAAAASSRLAVAESDEAPSHGHGVNSSGFLRPGLDGSRHAPVHTVVTGPPNLTGDNKIGGGNWSGNLPVWKGVDFHKHGFWLPTKMGSGCLRKSIF